MIDELIEQLNEAVWASPVSIEIVKMTEPIEQHGDQTLDSRLRKYDGDLLESFTAEIHRDLLTLETKHPELTHYRIGIYSITDKLVRYAKNIY